jgi:hypothetical protein
MNEFTQLSGNDTLLITIGDSWTTGVGCYDPESLARFQRKEIEQTVLYKDSIANFYKNAWPTILASKLNCDLINLAEGGAANSAMFKKLVMRVPELELSKYRKITVMFVLSDPVRFSFYVDGTIKSWIPHHHADPIANAYYKTVLTDVEDANRETASYLSGIKYFCDSRGFNFLYAAGFTNISEVNPYVNFKENNLHEYDYEERISNYLYAVGGDVLAYCGHPNQSGYQVIAEHFYSTIKSNRQLFLEIL